MDDGPDYEALFLANLGLLEQIVHGISRRHRLSADEAEELRADIRVKIIDNDYDVLRRFERRSSLRTYLTSVAVRLFLDQRNARWGKWRPSVEAKRLGVTAVLLEQFLTRDRLPFDQAVHILQVVHQVELSAAALRTMADRFPERSERMVVGEEALNVVADDRPAPDALLAQPTEAHVSRLERVLSEAVEELDARDRLLLSMHFVNGVTLADIARMQQVSQKGLYTRLARIKRILRERMEASGMTRDEILEILDSPLVNLKPMLGNTPPARPGQAREEEH